MVSWKEINTPWCIWKADEITNRRKFRWLSWIKYLQACIIVNNENNTDHWKHGHFGESRHRKTGDKFTMVINTVFNTYVTTNVFDADSVGGGGGSSSRHTAAISVACALSSRIVRSPDWGQEWSKPYSIRLHVIITNKIVNRRADAWTDKLRRKKCKWFVDGFMNCQIIVQEYLWVLSMVSIVTSLGLGVFLTCSRNHQPWTWSHPFR